MLIVINFACKIQTPKLSSFAPVCSHRAGKVCFKDGTIRAIKSASAGPGEIKSREVELGLRVGLFSLQLYPNSRATDIVFVTLFCTAVETAIACYSSYCACRADVVLVAVHGSLGLPGWAPVSRFHSSFPLSHSSPYLIGLLTSMDIKQQYSFTTQF